MLASAEMRWFWRDDCPADLRRWFEETQPRPGGGQVRIDEYLAQTNQAEIGVKLRGGKPDVEIKGLVATRQGELSSFAPCFELWCKWSLQASALDLRETIITRKVRWIRTYDASGAAIVEIPLQADEKPRSGRPLPEQGCNVEITRIQLAGDSRQWWTLGLEAYGDFDSAPRNLRRTTHFLAAHSFPRPSSGEVLSYPSWLARTKP